MTTLLWISGALAFVLALCVSIALHELGHLTVAKKFGLNVPTFMVGFGKRTLYSKKIGGTEYGLKPIPLGGYVRILDPKSDDPESPESQLLSNVAPWKRILVFLAGPMVNIVIGTVLFFVVFLTVNVQVPTSTIDSITCAQEQSCPAVEGGLKAGDSILTIEGNDVTDGIPSGLLNSLMATHNSLSFIVDRDGEEIALSVIPEKDAAGNYLVGIQLASEEGRLTPSQAASGTWMIYEQNVKAVLKLPTKVPELWRVVTGGERSDETPVSIVGATRVSGDIAASQTIATDDKGFRLVMLIASFNLGIGLINLLPLLPLDGGRILIAGVDSVKRRVAQLRKREFVPVGMTVMNAFTVVVLVLLVFYMGLAITADIVNPMKIN